MFKNKTVEIILPAYNEELSIKNYINDLEKLNIFDKILAVDNNSTDQTKNEILKTSAIYLSENSQGFGAAVKKGLSKASCDLIFISEPDGSFLSSDIFKLLDKIETYDVVFTSRTSNTIKIYLRVGNIIYGRFINLLFGGPKLSDAGSSLRLFRKDITKSLSPHLIYDGPELPMEITTSVLLKKVKVCEIDVSYTDRKGTSSYTGNFIGSLKVLLTFTKVVFLKFFRFI